MSAPFTPVVDALEPRRHADSTRALNVALVTEYYYPLLGGISENVHYTAQELLRAGHRVSIITSHLYPGDRNGVPVPPLPGLDIIRIGQSLPFHGNGARVRLTTGWRLFHRLRALLRARRFDVVHAHSPLFFTLPPLSVMAADCPSVGTFHSVFESSRTYSWFRKPLQRILDQMDLVTAVSDSCLTGLRQYFDIDAIIVPNGVDTDVFHPDAPRLAEYGPDKHTLLFVGRFDRRNGLDVMLRAFELVRQRRRDVRLVVVGDGALGPHYRGLVPPALAPDVHFVGSVLGNRPRYYATADIFCSPVNKASFGITLLEAMAAGVPVVAADNGGYRHVLSEREGVFVPPGDAPAFATAILDLLDDPERRRILGIFGREKAEQYSWTAVASQLVACYRQLVRS